MNDLFSHLQEHARRRPNAVALRQCRAGGEAGQTTFEALWRGALSFADAAAREPSAPSIIPLLLGKGEACVAAMFGALGAGKAFACLNRKFRAPQIARVLEAIGPTFGLVDGPGIAALESVCDVPAVRESRWRVVRDQPLLPPHERAVERLRGRLDLEYFEPPAHRVAGGVSPAPHQPDAPGCCLFTSGSTGVPKGVLISRNDLHQRAAAEAQWFELTDRDVLLNVLPFSFDVGLNQLLSSVVTGCTLVMLDSFLPADIVRAAAEFRVTGISGVPAIWSDMLARRTSFDTRGAHADLRYITVSGGDLPREQLERLPGLAPGAGIFKTYGQTETFRSTSLHPRDFARKPTSVGRAFGGARVYVVRPDGTQCDPWEEGEIVHAGLGTMTGYLGGHDPQDKLRANPFRGADDPADLAVFTGDIGFRDPDGDLHIRGRRDGMLKVSGNRFYPAEIVEQIAATGLAAQSEVLAVQSRDGESYVFAFVVCTPPAEADAAPALRRLLAARLPSYMVPRRVVVSADLPRTHNGKIDRPALTRRATQILETEMTGSNIVCP